MKDIAELLAQYRREFPELRPHEEDDWDWREDAQELVQAGKYDEAEILFKKLIVAEPEHFDGHEGLALLYQRLGRSEAVPLIMETYRMALKFFEQDTLDEPVLEEIEAEMKSIEETFRESEPTDA